MIIEKNELAVQKQIEYIKDKAGKVSELARSNKLAMFAHLSIASLIILSYIIEIFKGTRTVSYVLFVLFLGLVSPVAELIFYSKDKESKMIQHFVSYGYGVFYTFLILTTQNSSAYVYVIPMLIIIMVYNDYKYSLYVNISAIIVNIIQVIVFVSNGTYDLKKDSASIEIQILLMGVICICATISSRMLEFNNEYKMAQIKEQNEKTQNMFNTTMDVSGQMVSDIEDASRHIEELDNAIENTKEAMEQVSSGSNDTATAVQKQLTMTENIQSKINDVTSGTDEIASSLKETQKAINLGNENINALVEKVDASVNSGKQVSEELESLNEDMDKMNSVVDIINNITSQTSLLALNASIEAARAGEAGKGFAVVASEISKMANETQDATVKITDMIQDVTGALNRVVEVTGQMIEMIEGQNIATEKTAASFKTISDNTDNIFENSKSLADYVNELAGANKEIVDSISTISAISEEVAAHSGDTLSVSEHNIEIVSEVVAITEHLKELTTKLNITND